MSVLLKKFVFLSFLLFINTLNAEAFPHGCEVTGYSYKNNFLILNESSQQAFYLVQNKSDRKIELERQKADNSFLNPPLHISVDPMNWNAFASDEMTLFKCYKHIGEKTVSIDCSEVLEVCQYPRARFALSNKGNYWISSNKPQIAIIKDATANGIYLKW